jgi:hypothetical protein
MPKTLLYLISLAAVMCSVAGFVVAHPPLPNSSEVILQEYGDDMVNAVAGGMVGEIYDSYSTEGETCTGPLAACVAGPSPDCDMGDCEAVTSLSVPTCVLDDAWIGTFHCYHSGMECQNGRCSDGFACSNSVPFACSADWWWFSSRVAFP